MSLFLLQFCLICPGFYPVEQTLNFQYWFLGSSQNSVLCKGGQGVIWEKMIEMGRSYLINKTWEKMMAKNHITKIWQRQHSGKREIRMKSSVFFFSFLIMIVFAYIEELLNSGPII